MILICCNNFLVRKEQMIVNYGCMAGTHAISIKKSLDNQGIISFNQFDIKFDFKYCNR